MHLKNLLSFELQVVLAGVLAFLTCYFLIPKSTDCFGDYYRYWEYQNHPFTWFFGDW